MNKRQELAKKRFNKCLKVLEVKGNLYSENNDPNANIKRIAKLTNLTPVESCMKILWNKVYKVDLSIKKNPNDLDESLTDAINYLVILESLLKEK